MSVQKISTFISLRRCYYFILWKLELSNNFKAIDNIVTIDNNSKLIQEKHKSNLIVESDDNKVKSYEENEEEGSVRIFPQEEEKYIKSLPNVNTNGQVILRKL